MPTVNIEDNRNVEQVNTIQEIILGSSDIPSDFTIEEAVITILDKGGGQLPTTKVAGMLGN